MRNAECGMRNFIQCGMRNLIQCGMRNAECGIIFEMRNAECGMRNYFFVELFFIDLFGIIF